MKIDLENDYTLISHEEIKTFVENNQENINPFKCIKTSIKTTFSKN